MAQVNQIFNQPIGCKNIVSTNLAVAVAQAGNTSILELPVSGLDRVFCQFDVTVQDLDAFIIQGKCAGGAYQTLYSGSYTTPTGILVAASGALNTQAAATSGWFAIDVRGLEYIKVLASSANVAGSLVDVYAGGR